MCYVNVMIEKQEKTIEEILKEMRQEHSSIEEVPANKEFVVRLDTTDIVILSFAIGTVLSLIAVLIYKAFFAEPSHEEKLSKVKNNKDYIDVDFTEETSGEEFNYPYEDIEKILRES